MAFKTSFRSGLAVRIVQATEYASAPVLQARTATLTVSPLFF